MPSNPRKVTPFPGPELAEILAESARLKEESKRIVQRANALDEAIQKLLGGKAQPTPRKRPR